MFERFSRVARATVVQAQDEARRLGHERVGTEHLLLGLLSLTDSTSADVLAGYGVYHDDIASAVSRYVHPTQGGIDAAALETIGIDLSAVRDKVESTFGPGALDGPAPSSRRGHIPFSPRAKKALELSLREAIALRHKQIEDGHLVLGILREGEGLGTLVLAQAGVDLEVLRRDVTAALPSQRRAG